MGYDSQAFSRLNYDGTDGAFSLLVRHVENQVLYHILQ
jgi:hypothetical protein